MAPAGLRLHGRPFVRGKNFQSYPLEKGWDRLLSFVKAEALHYDAETVAMLEDTIQAGETPRVITMATCSSEYTDARTIVLAVLNDYGQENREDV